MANSDKNILITPNISAATGVYPTIKFNGANNTPINLSVLDDGTISFSSTAGQLFSISDGLTGTIFSVNDISGIPSIEVLDTGLVKINQYGGSTVFGSSAAIQNASSVNAKVSISTVSATTPGLIIKGVSSQSANLQEWQSSDGTVLSNIGPNGTVTLKSIASSNIATFFNGTNGYGAGNINYAGTFNINGANMGFPYTSSGAVLAVNATYAGSLPISVRGYASQTADLQQWQNSAGTVLSKIDYTGALRVDTNTVLNNTQTGGTTAYIKVNYANTIPLIVQGASSQTANLQEWQNSAGTVLVALDSAGNLSLPYNTLYASAVALNYLVNLANTNGYIQLSNGNVKVINRTTTSNNLLVVQGMSGQTGDLQQWQDSTGTVAASINSGGSLSLSRSLYTSASLGVWASVNADPQGGSTGNALTVQTYNTTSKGIVIKGVSSQTADLQQWQNSAGTVLGKVIAGGNIFATDFRTTNTYGLLGESNSGGRLYMVKQTTTNPNPGAGIGTLYFRDGTNAGTLKLVVIAGASGAETTILDNIPQS